MERTILEDFVILLLHPRKGRPMTMGNTLSQAVAAAAMTDVLLSGVIVLKDGKVKVKKLKFSGNKVQDTIVRRIWYARRPRTFKNWTGRFIFKGDRFLKETLQDLVQRNILYVRERRFLFFSRKNYFLIHRKERDNLLAELRGVISADGLPDLRQAVLLQLLASCNLSRQITRGRDQAAIFRKKIKAFRRDERILGEYAGILGDMRKTVESAAVTG